MATERQPELNAKQRAQAIRDQIAAKRTEVANILTGLQTDSTEMRQSSQELPAELLSAARIEIEWLRRLEDVLDVVTGKRERVDLELLSTKSLTLSATASVQEPVQPGSVHVEYPPEVEPSAATETEEQREKREQQDWLSDISF